MSTDYATLAAEADSNSRGHTDSTVEPLPQPVCLLHAPPPPPVHFIVPGFLPAGVPALLTGESGQYKSTIQLHVAAAVAGGYAILEAFPVPTPVPVLITSEEDDQGVIQNRLDALIAGHGWDPDRVLANLHVFALEGVRLDDARWREHLLQVGQRLGIHLYCFDPLSDLMTGDPEFNHDAQPVIATLRRLSTTGATTWTAHHLGKPKEGRTRLERVRGATSWVNMARAIWSLEVADGTLWLSRPKMSRLARDDTRWEVSVTITTDPTNAAMWISARLALAHPPGSWAVTSRRVLAPSERTALLALDRHRTETLSWTRWKDVSGLAPSTLSLAIPRLRELGYIQGVQTGTRAGKSVWGYGITAEGQVAALDSNDSNSTPK